MMSVTSSVHVKRVESQEIYADPDARAILQFLLRNLSTTIPPKITEADEITYPTLQSIIKEQADKPETVLSRMSFAGVLIADLADKVPICPECGSNQISTRYLCPSCFTFDITRSFLFEHLKCGKVASDDAFRKGDNLICPKCQIVLHDFGIEFRAVGAWYKCNRCDNSFNLATQSHFCRPNHHQFTPERAKLIPIYEYRLNASRLSEIRRQVLVYSELISQFENHGLTVIAPYQFNGKTGEAESFDIGIVTKGRWGAQKTITLDIIKSEFYCGPEAVRDFASKVKSAKPSQSYLVIVPGLKEDARELAKNLRVQCVEARTIGEAFEPIRNLEGIKELLP